MFGVRTGTDADAKRALKVAWALRRKARCDPTHPEFDLELVTYLKTKETYDVALPE